MQNVIKARNPGTKSRGKLTIRNCRSQIMTATATANTTATANYRSRSAGRKLRTTAHNYDFA